MPSRPCVAVSWALLLRARHCGIPEIWHSCTRADVRHDARQNRGMVMNLKILNSCAMKTVCRWAMLSLLTVSVAHAADTPLADAVAKALQASGLPASAVGMVVLPLHAKQPVLAFGAQQPMQPASTIKLVTSAVALDRLGAHHRGSTELLTDAPQVGDVLQGDLFLRGGADPELGLPQLWELLAELRLKGIRDIAGQVVLDRSLFRPARTDLDVPAFDDAPEFPYNVIPDALQLAGNLMSLELTADDKLMTARTVPALQGVELVNLMTLIDGPCARWADGGQWQPSTTTRSNTPQGTVVRIELRGQFPKNCTQRQALQLMDRNDLAQRLIGHAWASLGGTWRGSVVEGTTPTAARLLARRESRPWGEVLRAVNKRSDNPLTRLLFLSLGVAHMAAEPGQSTSQLAAREVKRWFTEHDITTEGLVLDNGSGLSRSERITPWQLARVVQEGLRGTYAPELLSSLPTVGVDGFMRERWEKSAASGRARLKPGGLRNVVSYAGMVLDANNEAVVMVIIVNHNELRRARGLVDALLEWVATSKFPQSAAQ